MGAKEIRVMSDRGFEPDDLAELAGLSPDDPRGRALEPDPRLRARIRLLEEFEKPGSIPEGARVAEAEARLAETLGRELGVPVGRESESPAEERVRMSELEWRRRSQSGRRRGFLGQLLTPSLAAAAVLVVVAGAWFMVSTRKSESPVMRGPTPAAPTGALVGSATPIAGGVRLAWTAHPEAQAYVVTILAPDLTEIVALDPVTETHLDFAVSARNETLAPDGQMLWRVVAVHGADEVGRSQTMSLTLPR
jgi:hypothetical protein